MNEINKNQINFFKVSENDDNQRLDNLLIKILKGVPKSHIYRIIRSGEVRVNKARSRINNKIKTGDVIRIPPIRIAKQAGVKMIPQAAFPILFEDEYYLIIDKPSGTACHGGSGISFGVIEQLRQHTNYKFLELAHRLDKETSGILILAKKRLALVKLQELMKNNQMQKEYYALCLGVIPDKTRNVKAPVLKYLTKDGQRRVKIDSAGQFAHTVFTIKERFANFTLVNARLHTGRTHQIRIHLHLIGYPIALDDKYGDFTRNHELQKAGLKRMFLHAHHISFIHPITQQPIDVTSPLPDSLLAFLKQLD